MKIDLGLNKEDVIEPSNETLPIQGEDNGTLIPSEGEGECSTNGEDAPSETQIKCIINPEGGQPPDSEILIISGVTRASYLRTDIGEYYDGLWYGSDDRSHPYNSEYVDYKVTNYNQSFSTHFTIEPLVRLHGFIPVPVFSNKVSISVELHRYPGYMLYWSPSLSNETYDVISTSYTFGGEVLRVAEPWYNETYLQVPEALRDKLASLASNITESAASPYEKLKALETHLKTNYVYALNYTRAPPDVDPVEWFLFHERRGVCANFNSAFVLLARSVGLPARLVAGYAIDSQSSHQVVNSRQAHAWSEVPFRDIGWISFDATASGSGSCCNPDGSDDEGECKDCQSEGKVFNEDQGNMTDIDVIISPEGGSNSSCPLFAVYGRTYTMYLRSKVGEIYDGLWHPLELPYEDHEGHAFIDSSVNNSQSSLVRSFIVKPLTAMGGFLPHAQHTTEIHLGYLMHYFPQQDMLFTPKVFNNSYHNIYTDYVFEQEALQAAQPIPSEAYLQVPEALRDKLASLASNITESAASPYEKLKALETHLKTNYVYALNYTRAPPDVDPVEWFLFHERRGVCANFNSAFVLLARSVGLPARLVAGYLVSSDTEYQIVRCNDRHAWAEVPFQHIGWLTFDATASCDSCSTDEIVDGSQISHPLPTVTEIVSMDALGVKGLTFNVEGYVEDATYNPVDGMKVIIYLNEEKYSDSLICGEGKTEKGVFNIDCQLPLNISNGFYNVQAKSLGNEKYLESWSDPQIKIVTKTVASLEAPDKVIEGRQFKACGNLTIWKTGEPLKFTDCKLTTNTEGIDLQTNEKGEFEHNILFNSSGTYNIDLKYQGSEFYLASNNSQILRVVPLTISLYQTPILIRGETVPVQGKVHAENLPGDNESVHIFLNSTHLTSLKTDEKGGFFYPLNVSNTNKLGNVTIISVDSQVIF